MEHAISEIFGEGVDARGASIPIYRALRRLLCSACGAPIPLGAFFTRKAIPGIAPRIMPRCRECAPFELRSDEETKKSPLIENLLTPADGKPDATGEPSLKASEEVERRLGPALSRARAKRETRR